MVIFVLSLVTVATLALLLRRLPLQNILAAACIVVVAAIVLETLNAWTGFPFGHSIWQKKMTAEFPAFSWQMLLLWIALLFNSRELARWILRRQRQAGHYGLWLLAVAAALCALLWMAVEFIEAKEFSISLWKFFVGKFLASLIILAAIAPWMIQKKPA